MKNGLLSKKYILVKKIKETNFGAVYIGRLTKINLTVAIKISDTTIIKNDPICSENPTKEIEIMRKCCIGECDNVVRYIENFKINNLLFLIMEYVDGGELYDSICKQLNIHVDSVLTCRLEWFRDIVNGVEYIHNNDIAHLDISLENCLLSCKKENKKRYNVEICDFGMAQKSLVRITERKGKEKYRAPELWVFSKLPDNYDSRCADIFSLGVLCFVLIKNQYPFISSDINNIDLENLSQDFMLGDAKLQNYVSIMLRRMLFKDYNKRIKITEVKEILQRIFNYINS